MANMRIAIDARMAGVEQRGIGRMVLGFLQNLERALDSEQSTVNSQQSTLDSGNHNSPNPSYPERGIDFEIDILLRKENFDCVEFSDSRIQKVVADYHWYGWREQIQYLFFLLRKRYDLVFFTHFNMPLLYFRPYAVFIHDLQMIQWKDERQSTKTGLVYHMKHQVLRILMWKAVRFAKKIIVPSKTVKRDLEQNYQFLRVSPKHCDRNEMEILRDNEESEKVVVVYEGVVWSEPEYDDSVLEKYKLFFERTPRNAGEVEKFTHVNFSTSSKNIMPYILYVGAFYLHKNVKTLVEAFGAVDSQQSTENSQQSTVNKKIKLVLVGKLDYFGQKLKEWVKEAKEARGIEEGENVIFTGFLPDAQLNSLYRNCALYVHPSLSEGFNLSPMEAMRAGAKKVLISDISVNKEIYGSRVPTADCRTSERLAQAIRIQLSSNTTLVDIDYFRRTYSFEKMTREIWGLLMEEKVG